MSASKRLAWAFAVLGACLVLSVALLVTRRLRPALDTGFTERVTQGPRCDDAASESTVREPFVPYAEDSSPRCVRWTASLVARSATQAKLESFASGSVSIAIDGHAVISDDVTGAPRAKQGAIALAPGVHNFIATYQTPGGPAYFRLSMDDENDPHDVAVVAPLNDDAFFPTSAAAEGALASPAPASFGLSALVAALALAAAGVCAWLSVRVARGRAVPVADLALALALFAVSLFVRVRALGVQDVCWDEGIVSASEHQMRNLVLGDYFGEAWRHDLGSPPLSKWLLAIGDAVGGLNGARYFVGVAGAASVSLLFTFGLLAFGRRVGLIAGMLAVFFPLLVAHSRVAGSESFVLLWWCLSMVAFAVWARSSDGLAAFACAFAAICGVFSRFTGGWILPALAVGWLLFTRGSVRERLRAFPRAALAGGACALGLVVALWPFLWSDPIDKLSRMHRSWAPPLSDFEVYFGTLRMPEWHYFVVAFVAETPALILLAAVVGVASSLRADSGSRAWGGLCLAWLTCPFGQSLSVLRIGAGRLVIQSWPALLIFAALALASVGDGLALLRLRLSDRARAWVSAAASVGMVAYTAVALWRVEPYPLDYFGELVGGPSGVASRKMFEIPWWGEGNLAAVRALDDLASHDARVHLALWPKHTLPRLRADLARVEDPAGADYVLVSHIQYFERPPAGCTAIAHVEVRDAPLVDTYACTPPNALQLGFGAMTRGATDDAFAQFRKALEVARPKELAPALFGIGWAMQAKGELGGAEGYYGQAIELATLVRDTETEYFARYDLGTLYVAQDRYEEARASLARARALRPSEAAVNSLLVEVEAKAARAAASAAPIARPAGTAAR